MAVRLSQRLRNVLIGGALIGILADPVSAQVTQTVAIQGARVVQSPDRVIERGTVVFHDGVITAVGTSVDVPFDARIIEGDSLTIYAGFVDGLSHAGVQEPDDADSNGDVNRADPPDELAGIQPHRSVRVVLDPSHDSIGALREVGFTAAHVVPRGRMLPGTGAVVLLTGDDPDDMILRPSASLFFQFEGGPGVYPATPMGIMAKMRQLLREAERRRRIERLYAEDPSGLARPDFDAVHESLYPILSGSTPVFAFVGQSALEAHRILQLRDELGFSLSLAGLHQGFDLIGTVESAGVPLFLTLNLPIRPDSTTAAGAAADTAHATTSDEPAPLFVRDLRTRSHEDVDRELQNLEARQTLEREKYDGTAARFYEEGLRFGFTTLGADADDLRDNVRRMIDGGLPEEAALAALTIDGARLLGIDRSAGTVDVGKLANLVVVRGSYFEPDDVIAFVVVDGTVYRLDGG